MLKTKENNDHNRGLTFLYSFLPMCMMCLLDPFRASKLAFMSASVSSISSSAFKSARKRKEGLRTVGRKGERK